MHKALFTLAALSLTAPVAVFAQPAASPPAAAPPRAPAPAPAAPTTGGRIEFVSNPVIQAAPEPKTGDRPVCRGDVTDSCIQPGAARQQRR
ncbi:MAG TPA: hypothetical protein VFS49_00095 [Croceibacterium sp.]|nr:hypothetical protein [Croceibacterium sp.]